MSKHGPHLIDGKMMTTDQIAEMLGITRGALYERHSKVGAGTSWQAIVDMYREGMFGRRGDIAPRHLVHGRWMTACEVADECRVTTHTIENYRYLRRDAYGRKPTVEDAYDHYQKYLSGELKRYPGSIARLHRVRGRWMTIGEAAEMCGVWDSTLVKHMKRYNCSLSAAVKRVEKLKTARATRKILKVIYEVKTGEQGETGNGGQSGRGRNTPAEDPRAAAQAPGV